MTNNDFDTLLHEIQTASSLGELRAWLVPELRDQVFAEHTRYRRALEHIASGTERGGMYVAIAIQALTGDEYEGP